MIKKTKIAFLSFILLTGIQNASAMQAAVVERLIETGVPQRIFKTLAPSVQFSFSSKKERKVPVFCNPTRDVVAKYLLDDDQIRNSFIRALTPFKDVQSSRKLDNTLRPLKLDQNLLNILKEEAFVRFLNNPKSLQLNFSNLSQRTEETENLEKEIRIAQNFFKHLRENYEEINQVLLDDKGPVSDVICKLGTGEHILVEVQVERQDFWDKRALAYASMLFGNQLRKGDEWRELKDVIAVNILGTGKDEDRKFWPKESYYKRHFVFQDQFDKTKMPLKLENIQVIQYSLGNVNINNIQNSEEKAWLDFFKNAHHYQDIPKNSPDIMKSAYERISSEQLPHQIKELYEKEENQFRNFKGRFEEERNLGKIEVAYDLGLSDEQISEKYKIPLDVVRSAVSEIKNNN